MYNPLTLLALGFGGALFALIATRLGKSLPGKNKRLKPYFKRLGEIAPTSPCPCKKPGGPYQQCCRPQDLAKIEMEVRNFIFTDWMRRSGGRSRARPMKARLEDFPIPETTLPDWVTAPADHLFPIEESILHAWSPVLANSESADHLDTSDNVPI